MKTCRTLIAAASLLSVLGSAQAAWILGGQSYTQGSTTESLSAAFNSATGALSSNSYTGYVLVEVSGTGNSFANILNDAFYVFGQSTSTTALPNYGLVITRSADVTAGGGGANDDASRHIVYDILGNTAVGSAPYFPAYQANHTYSFILDSAALTGPATQLRFGVDDGQYGDNGGSFNITVTQLVQGTGQTVPEPTSLLLMGGALGLLAASRRRRAAR